MLTFKPLAKFAHSLLVTAALIALTIFTSAWDNPAIAASQNRDAYIAADGQDLTAIVECLPEELSEGNLQRAIAESGQDYLEQVFQLKDTYSDYDIGTVEQAFQACLKAKGITPQAESNQL